MSKGTIIYIGGFELPDKNAASHRVIANGKALRDLGYDVVFIGIDNSGLVKDPLKEKELIFGFDSYKRPKPKNIMEWFGYLINIDLYKNIILRYEKVEAIIGYNLPSIVLIHLKSIAQSNNIRIFSDCTEWYKGSLKVNAIIGVIKRIDNILRMHFVQPKLDGIIAISEFLDVFYSKKGIKVIKIPPLVDYKDRKWVASFGKSNDKINIVYAGGAFSLKDAYVKDRLDLVVEALSYLKLDGFNFCFNVVGCTLDDFRKFYPNLITNLDLLKNDIIFYGKVSHKDSIELIKKADYSIFVRDENVVTQAGFPTKFVESITCGTLVLTNRNSNVVDYLIQGKNGFIIDTDSINSIIKSLIEPLSIKPFELQAMKKTTYESHVFDYRKFKKQFEILLS